MRREFFNRRCFMEQNDLILNVEMLHTTELGEVRIRRNLSWEEGDVVARIKELILRQDAEIVRRGKNWYVSACGCVITVNAYSYTIITAHKERG